MIRFWFSMYLLFIATHLCAITVPTPLSLFATPWFSPHPVCIIICLSYLPLLSNSVTYTHSAMICVPLILFPFQLTLFMLTRPLSKGWVRVFPFSSYCFPLDILHLQHLQPVNYSWLLTRNLPAGIYFPNYTDLLSWSSFYQGPNPDQAQTSPAPPWLTPS